MAETKNPHRIEDEAELVKYLETYHSAKNAEMQARWNLINELQQAIRNEIGHHLLMEEHIPGKPRPQPNLQQLMAVARLLGLIR